MLKDVLLAKSDELTHASRSFLEALKDYLKRENKSSFYAKELRQRYRYHPATLNRHLIELLRFGYIKITGGSKHRQGFEYELEAVEEYSNLKANIKTALDKALQSLIQKSKEYLSISPVSQ